MRFDSIVRLFAAMNAADVSYIVVGGLAVNAHGYQRLTHDIDLCLEMREENVRAALTALTRLGYRPMLPVDSLDFADPVKRAEWVSTRNMEVFSLVSEEHRNPAVDLFATVPFDFGVEYELTMNAEIAPGVHVKFAALSTLIAMKETTGRARDEDDIRHMRMILEAGDHDEP
jgi:hypothetical protein